MGKERVRGSPSPAKVVSKTVTVCSFLAAGLDDDGGNRAVDRAMTVAAIIGVEV